jgi:hypothetical protein
LGGQISTGAIRFQEKLKAEFGRATFTTTDAVTHTKLSRQSVNDYLWELAGVDAATQIAERKGNQPAEWRLPDEWDGSLSFALPLLSDDASLCQVNGHLTQNGSTHRDKPLTAAVSGENPAEKQYDDGIPF